MTSTSIVKVSLRHNYQ